jgi:hypothetical protein
LPECSRQVISGSEPRLCEEGCKKGFKAYSARVNFIVHWKKDKEPEKPEIEIVLPRLLCKRSRRSENTF